MTNQFPDATKMVPFPPPELVQQLCDSAALRALLVRINGANAIRQDILAIADELEAL